MNLRAILVVLTVATLLFTINAGATPAQLHNKAPGVELVKAAVHAVDVPAFELLVIEAVSFERTDINSEAILLDEKKEVKLVTPKTSLFENDVSRTERTKDYNYNYEPGPEHWKDFHRRIRDESEGYRK